MADGQFKCNRRAFRQIKFDIENLVNKLESFAKLFFGNLFCQQIRKKVAAIKLGHDVNTIQNDTWYWEHLIQNVKLPINSILVYIRMKDVTQLTKKNNF